MFTFINLGSGKSTFVFRLLKFRNEMIDTILHEIIYCLPKGQKISMPDYIKNDRKIKFFEGIPDYESFNDKMPRLIILDDLMAESGQSVVNMFTKGSHHYNLSVMLLTQNLFLSSPGFRTISLNAHYIVVGKNPRDRNQINHLAMQLAPGNVKFIQEAYADATNTPYGYLFIDVTQKCNEELRIRSSIFPDDSPQNIIYIPMEK
jgi:hypothetical protein